MDVPAEGDAAPAPEDAVAPAAEAGPEADDASDATKPEEGEAPAAEAPAETA